MANYVNSVLDFLVKQTGKKKKAMNFDTTLSTDLNLSKSETKQLLKIFSQQFNVDIKKLRIDSYEFPERNKESKLSQFLNSLMFWNNFKKKQKTKNQYSEKRLITVSMLINSAQKGKWAD